MAYDGGTPAPPGVNRWVIEQLQRIANESAQPSVSSLRFKKLSAAPARVYDTLTVYADGTNWNPGSGEGLYVYRGAAWHFLG